MTETTVRRIVEEAIRAERERIASAVERVRIPTQTNEAGFQCQIDEFCEFRDAIVDAVRGGTNPPSETEALIDHLDVIPR